MNSKNGAALGRVLLSLIFLIGGITKVAHFTDTRHYMVANGMFAPTLFLIMAIVVEIGGGLSLLFGYWARHWALALALYLVPVTLVFHQFWKATGGDAQTQLIQFEKNLAIIGGLLYVVRVGALELSLDRKLHTRDESPEVPPLRRATVGGHS